MKIDIDPIEFEGGSPLTNRRRLTILLGILVIGAVAGFFALQRHRQAQKEAVFTYPFTTAVTMSGKELYQIEYRSEIISGQFCFDIGGLRIVTPSSEDHYYGTTSGTFNLSPGSNGTHSSGGSPWNIEIANNDLTATIEIGPLRIQLDRTTATIGGQEFDIETEKHVIVVESSGRITEQRLLP